MSSNRFFPILTFLVLACAGLVSLIGCNGTGLVPQAIEKPQPTVSQELVLYYWSDSMPQDVLDAFTNEYHVRVVYQTYGSQEEAIGKMQSGSAYDVVILDNDKIPDLVNQNLIAPLDMSVLTNYQNINPAYRNLGFDPGNNHAVMFHWGTTGILYRKDLISKPVTRWADLWDKDYAGKVAVYPSERDLLCISLKSLGYSCNSEKPVELDAALKHLRDLNPALISLDTTSVAPLLNEGKRIITYGWSFDGVSSQEVNSNIDYVYPQEGTLQWAEYLVIPANSPHIYTAELFINFLLRPEINAMLVNETKYPSPLQSALPGIQTDILRNPIIFPPADVMKSAEWELPLSPEGQKLWYQVWNRYLTGE